MKNTSYFGIGPNYSFLGLERGADARYFFSSRLRCLYDNFTTSHRLILLDENRILVCYAHSNSYHVVRMRLAELSVHADTGLVTVGSQYRLMPIYYAGIGGEIHKNWSPFLYNGSVCFIETINPFRVIR